ncbi:uncharacterized protein BDZ83DRAFT_650798 [Colletotrichum acutatum]|uniref:Uncharacterized protein n=1 Tax=Glomerella acutata TaxID=27357 RepID=A0AAD8UM95_GLOAC|nr:uncharacterized protein BDZ83DRAFT_650798 [Colletotrichum acutatum]KAK1725973.1 hypothetical protein BDZ83DRAFT_650798 [Colletotrichum acutatum]
MQCKLAKVSDVVVSDLAPHEGFLGFDERVSEYLDRVHEASDARLRAEWLLVNGKGMRCKFVANPTCRYRWSIFEIYTAATMRGVELPVQEPNVEPSENPNCLPMSELTVYLYPYGLAGLAIPITVSTPKYCPQTKRGVSSIQQKTWDRAVSGVARVSEAGVALVVFP